MYCDLWPYVLFSLDFQIQKRIVSAETIWGNIGTERGVMEVTQMDRQVTEGLYNSYHQVDNVWFDNYYVSTTIIYVLSKRKYKKLLKVLHTISYTYWPNFWTAGHEKKTLWSSFWVLGSTIGSRV